MCGVPWVSVAEVVLDEAEVLAAVGERESAGMAQGVRVQAGQAGTQARGRDQVVACQSALNSFQGTACKSFRVVSGVLAAGCGV